jgi:hypothetical protein
MRTIRQAIPLDEILANMKNDAASCCKTKYSRKSTFITESEADARAIIGVSIASLIAILAICSTLWVIWHSIDTAQAQPVPICAQSDMTPAQLKALNVIKPHAEKIQARRHDH